MSIVAPNSFKSQLKINEEADEKQMNCIHEFKHTVPLDTVQCRSPLTELLGYLVCVCCILISLLKQNETSSF